MIKRRQDNQAHFSRNTRNIGSSRARTQFGSGEKVRYAVVGLGHIAQNAVLPAFKHASKNSELVALFSEDPKKLKELGRKYRVTRLGKYADFTTELAAGGINAVYVAEPNSRHREFTVKAAAQGAHVLCEKPLAVTERECEQMISACRKNNVKLMTAYRLHFERSNLEAIKVVRSGKIGDPRYFSSVFSMQVRPGDIRVQKRMGGGTLYDLGVYCINAARYLFQSEPVEAMALTESGPDKRFKEVEEMAGALLRFPENRLATFICSFGAADIANYDIVGDKGVLQMKNGYEYSESIEMKIISDGKQQTKEFAKRDQFAAELIYFSDCVLKDREPEPSGIEGYNDIRVVQALYESSKTGKAVAIKGASKNKWPSMRQEIRRQPVKKPELVNTQAPHQE
jgi:glucose-fructose oxidoreductase